MRVPLCKRCDALAFSVFKVSTTSSLPPLLSLRVPFFLPLLPSHPLGIKCQDHSLIPKAPGDTLLSLC